MPIFAQTAADAAGQAAALGATAADLAELRLDPLRAGDGSLPDAAALCAAVRRVRAALDGRLPLLVTLRTGAEGGSRPCTPEEYAALLGGLLDAAGAFELLDVEFAAAGPQLPALCRRGAGRRGWRWWRRSTTLPKRRRGPRWPPQLCAMGDAGADIAKLAVMPAGPADAAELLAATALARSRPPCPAADHHGHGPGRRGDAGVRRGLWQLRHLWHRGGVQRAGPAGRRPAARRPGRPGRLPGMTVPPGAAARRTELLDNGTKVLTAPGAAFGTDALLLARFAQPRPRDPAADLCRRLRHCGAGLARRRPPGPLHCGGDRPGRPRPVRRRGGGKRPQRRPHPPGGGRPPQLRPVRPRKRPLCPGRLQPALLYPAACAAPIPAAPPPATPTCAPWPTWPPAPPGCCAAAAS